MKKILLTVFAILSFNGIMAQSRMQSPSGPGRLTSPSKVYSVDLNQIEKVNLPSKSAFKTSATPDTFITRNSFLTSDSNAYIWVNMAYDTIQEQKWRFTAAYFDALHDSDPTSPTFYPFGNAADSIVIDSLYAFVSHKKTSPSSVTDTIEFRVLDYAGTILWTGYRTTTTNLFNGNLTGAGAVGLVRIPCGLEIPVSITDGIGVQVRFRGAMPQDSFSILATYPKKGVCTLGNNSANPSYYRSSSYVFLGKVDTASSAPPSYVNYYLPGDFMYYNDCNNNSQQDTTPTFYTSNELFEFQNAEIFMWATRHDRLPVSVMNTIEAGVVKVYPNPTTGILNMQSSFSNAENVNVKLTDVTGKVVFTQDLGSLTIDSRSFDISNLIDGVYIFEVNTEKGKSIHKIVKN